MSRSGFPSRAAGARPIGRAPSLAGALALLLASVAAPPAIRDAAPAPFWTSARAEGEAGPRGQVAVQGFAATRQPDQVGGAVAGRLDLTETISLEGFFSRSYLAPGRSDLAYGKVQLGSFRIVGGLIGDDQAFHLGYGPALDVALAGDALALHAGFDLALGAGFLGDFRSSGKDSSPWRDVYPAGVDFYSAAIALDLRLTARPVDALELTVGAYGDLLAAAAAPESDPARMTPFDRSHPLRRYTHPGISSSLSEAAAGLFGQAALQLHEWGAPDGPRSRLTLSYTELWDWIHLDPTYTVFEYTSSLDAYPLRKVPPRTTRRLGLELGLAGEERALSLGVDVQRVQGSTTLDGFGDRNGWSVGARAAARMGRLYGEVSGRYHFSPAEVEYYVGEIPRFQVAAKVGVVLVESGGAGVRLELGARSTVEDALGIPRAGHALTAQLEVAFGGTRPGRREALLGDEYLYHPARGLGVIRTSRSPARRGEEGDRVAGPDGFDWGGDAGQRVDEVAERELGPDYLTRYEGPLREFLRRLAPDEASAFLHEVRRLNEREGGFTADDVRESLDRNPRVRDRFEAEFPGLIDLAVSFLAGEAGGPAVVAGYGRRGIELGTVRSVPRSPPDERSEEQDLLAPEDGRPDGPGDDVTLAARAKAAGMAEAEGGAGLEDEPPQLPSMRRFVHDKELEKFTLLVPRDGKYQVVFQGRTQWSRFMRRLLTDR